MMRRIRNKEEQKRRTQSEKKRYSVQVITKGATRVGKKVGVFQQGALFSDEAFKRYSKNVL